MKPNVFFAELVGTFILVFIGAGVAAGNASGLIGVALAFGLAAATLVYLFGEISGTQLNPAVTFALALDGEVQWVEAVFYWIAQFLGGVVAGVALYFVYGGPQSGLGATQLGSGTSPLQGVVIETILTFILMTSIFFAAVKGYAGKRAGFVIGVTILFLVLLGGPLTGASLNPARTLGPTIFSGKVDNLWIYFAGPLLGAGLAAGFYRLMHGKK